MLEFQTADEVANYIRMMRSSYNGTIIIVEGKTDVLIYGRLLNGELCTTIPANNKENAINALDIIEEGSYDGVLAIVDSDFWRIDGNYPIKENLFATDTHDLESLILSSNALEKVLAEYGDGEQIGRFEKSIRQILLENALPIGLIRWLSLPHKKNLCINFKEMRFSEFIDSCTFKVNIDILIEHIKTGLPVTCAEEQISMRDIKALMKQKNDLWQICCGHDLVKILLFGLRNIFGNYAGRNITLERLDSLLRVAYEESHFRTTQLFASLIAWEARNSPYEIL
jgi:hypothetical protein